MQQERDDLEARIHNNAARIETAKERRSGLAATNQQLVRRAGDAAAALLDVRRTSQSGDPATASPAATPPATHGPSATTAPISIAPVVSVYMPVPRPRPVDAFAHHVPLSLDAVLAHAPQDPCPASPGGGGAGAHPADNLPGMAAAYKGDVATTVRRPVEDICWFLQTPFHAAPAATLSFTTTLSSLECCASFLVFYFATTLEGAFMAQERALADGSATPGAHPLAITAKLRKFLGTAAGFHLPSHVCLVACTHPQCSDLVPVFGRQHCSCNGLLVPHAWCSGTEHVLKAT